MTKRLSSRKIKECKRHGTTEHAWRGDDRRWRCLKCHSEYNRTRNHAIGKTRPLDEAKDTGAYLGVYVAERVLSKFFNHIERMPYGNPGYDFICGKGYKIDVKSACLYLPPGAKTSQMQFLIKKNIVTDYFLCLGFDDRDSLEPIHVWLIPGNMINHLSKITICMGQNSIAKWREHEKPLDKVVACCNEMKEGVRA